MTSPDRPQVVAVNVVHHVAPGFFHDTAIDKRPVDGPVAVEEHGLVGDRQVDSSHGGPDKAVYAYAEEDAGWWAAELGRDIPAGLFGENLRLRGVDVTHAVVGERWWVGEVLLEVRMPRTPCPNLSMRMGIERFHLRFNATGRVGALLRVVEPGTVRAGDPVEVVLRPAHQVTVADLATGPDAAQMRALLDSGVPLAAKLQARARRVVARAEAQDGTQQ
jgi:MOSC domain-containing protein YiiM